MPCGRHVEGQSKIMRSLKFLLACQLLVALLAALVLAGTAVVSKQRLGETAGRALVAKDVTADVLPPPMYLIELRLVLAQGLDGTLPATSVRDEVARLVREYQDRVAYWGSNPPFGLERELLGAQHAAAEQFIAAAQSQVVAPLLANNRAGAATALPDVHRLYLAHRAGVDATVKSASTFAANAQAGFEQAQATAIVVALSVFGGASALLIGFFFWLRRAVWASVGAEPAEIAAVARVVAEGDLTRPVATHYPDSVAGSLERMRVQMAKVVGEVRAGVDSVNTASREIAAGNQDLSSRTEEQASSLQDRPRRRSSRSPAPCSRVQTTRARPTPWRARPATWRRAAARWWATWSPRWTRSATARAGSATSSA
jgi:hypothetical protein